MEIFYNIPTSQHPKKITMQNQISNEKIVILDRDGVINFDSDQFIKSPNEFKLILLYRLDLRQYYYGAQNINKL